jgi:O-acetyl-ADP-ribose deacetylase (regulator of RNase III)
MIFPKSGDIFTTDAQAIGHGCNCKGSMGVGIAASIKKRYPQASAVYRDACARGAFRPGTVQVVETSPHLIINLATQDEYGVPIWRGGGVWARPEWIKKCLVQVATLASERSIDSIAFPKVGCRHGGLFWDVEDYDEKRRKFGFDPRAVPRPDVFVEQLFAEAFTVSPIRVELWTRSEQAGPAACRVSEG